jgi:hypothetical protein
LLGQQVHHDPCLLGTDGQIHGTTYGRNSVDFSRMPIGQIASGTDLKSAQHTNVQMTTSHHGKAVGMMKIRTSWQQRNGLLAGVDQVVVFVAGCRRRTHSQNTILAVQQNFKVRRNMVGNQRRLTNA